MVRRVSSSYTIFDMTESFTDCVVSKSPQDKKKKSESSQGGLLSSESVSAA